jgi:hypothetical protein
MNEPKVTQQQDAEIVRRLATGETQTSIAKSLGVSRTTIQRHAKDEQARIAAQEAAAAREQQLLQQTEDEAEAWVVNFSPRAEGPLFYSREQRLRHYEARRLESHNDYLNYNDALRGRLMKRELRAKAKGRPMFLHVTWEEQFSDAA